MKFIVFTEDNKKENETMVFFLQYDGNETMIDKLEQIICNTDFSEMEGDYSIFNIRTNKKISRKSVLELADIDIGNYSSMFNICEGIFEFPYKEFDTLDPTEKALKLDELFYACRIEKYFKKERNNNDLNFEHIFDAWKNQVSTSDVYELILDWINNHEDEIMNHEMLDLIYDIKERMSSGDETNDIVEDFIYGEQYENLRNYFRK